MNGDSIQRRKRSGLKVSGQASALWTVAIALVLVGCKRSSAPNDADHDAGQPRWKPVDATGFVLAVSDAGVDPREFAGFSEDEQRFGWSAHSVGAGAVVLTIQSVSSDGGVMKLLLDDESERARALALLRDGGFTTARRLPPDGELEVGFTRGGISLSQRLADGGEALVFEGAPFGETAFVRPVSARFWGLSPSGRIAVLETVSAPHPEFGSAKSFVFLPAESTPRPQR